MYFLVQYDRAAGQLSSIKAFKDRSQAQDERLAVEIGHLRRGEIIEVVLLEAQDEDALKTTHRRYFEHLADLADLAKAPNA